MQNMHTGAYPSAWPNSIPFQPPGRVNPALGFNPQPFSTTQFNMQPRPPAFGIAPGFAVRNRHGDLLSQKLDRSVLVRTFYESWA